MDTSALMKILAAKNYTSSPSTTEQIYAQGLNNSPAVSAAGLFAAQQERKANDRTAMEAQRADVQSAMASLQQAMQQDKIEQAVELAKAGMLGDTTPLVQQLGLPVDESQASLDEIIANKNRSEVLKNTAGATADMTKAGYMPSGTLDGTTIPEYNYNPSALPELIKTNIEEGGRNSRNARTTAAMGKMTYDWGYDADGNLVPRPKSYVSKDGSAPPADVSAPTNGVPADFTKVMENANGEMWKSPDGKTTIMRKKAAQ